MKSNGTIYMAMIPDRAVSIKVRWLPTSKVVVALIIQSVSQEELHCGNWMSTSRYAVSRLAKKTVYSTCCPA